MSIARCRPWKTTTRTFIALVCVAVLTACSGGSSSDNNHAPGDEGTPQRGGSLTLGASGGASSDTIDPHNALTNTDFARLALLYDPLVKADHTGKLEYRLAKSMTYDSKSKTWTITLRPGITTHGGKKFTADDVLWNFKRIIDNKFPGGGPLGPVDLAESKAVNATTLKLVYKSPFTILPDVLIGLPYYYMVPRTWTPKNPDGTGPFSFDTFEPGVRSTSKRFANYWDNGKPYLNEVTVLNLADETTQLNALNSGQVDAIDFLSAQSVKQAQSGSNKVVISQTGGWAPITMRVDKAPFNDVRVRSAFKLIADRDQINKVVYGGYGTIGNDVFGIYDSSFKKLPQRKQDIAQAKKLLAEAGQSNLKITLITNDVVPAQRAVAQLFAQQAKAAGVDITVKFETASTFFAGGYLTATFAQDYWFTVPYLANAAGATTPNAPFNATHNTSAEYGDLYNKAVAEPDPATRAAYAQQMQKMDYDEGGNIIPVFYPIIDATSSKVNGVSKDVSGFPMGNWDFQDIWKTP